MRITTRVTYASLDDFINNAQPAIWEGFEYDGPVATCKKGRQELQGATTAGLQNTKQAQDIAGQAEKIGQSEINTNGGLSPLVSKQLASEQGMIGKTYANAAQGADRGMAQRGMGAAPSGLSSSIKNTAINNAGQAQTGAVGNAFGTQNQLNNSAFNQANQALGAANQGVQATTGAGSALNQAGSTLGDVASGLNTMTNMAATICPAEGSLYLMADGTEKPVENLQVGDEIKGIDDEAQLIEEIQSGFIDTIFVTTENGYRAHNSLIHAYALPKGGFAVAAKSLGKFILTGDGPSKVTSVEPAGKAWVFNVITNGSHTYRADGVWGLGVGDGEKQIGSNVWARVNRKLAEETELTAEIGV